MKYWRGCSTQAGLRPRGKSRRVERVLCDFGAESSFAKSGLRLKEHYGFELGPSAVREATLFHAARAEKKLEAHYAENFRALPKNGPARIIVQTDGTMIRTVAQGRRRKDKRVLEWKEMRLSAACAQGRKKAHYVAGFTGVEATGRRMAPCARAAGWALENRIHLIADGAEWIWHQSQEIFGNPCDFLLDFYHVSEYLAAAAPSCRPSDEKGWLRTQQKRLKRGAAQPVLQTMSEHEESADTPRRTSARAGRPPIPEPTARAVGRPSRPGQRPAHRFRPHRKRPPTRAPSPPQTNRQRMESPQRPRPRATPRPPLQLPVGCVLGRQPRRLTPVPTFNHTRCGQTDL